MLIHPSSHSFRQYTLPPLPIRKPVMPPFTIPCMIPVYMSISSRSRSPHHRPFILPPMLHGMPPVPADMPSMPPFILPCMPCSLHMLPHMTS